MSTSPQTSVQPASAQGAPAPHLIEQRLEALDQALVGLLPRHDRLATVAQVEARVREFAAANPTKTGTPPGLPPHDPAVSQPTFGTLEHAAQSRFHAVASGGWTPTTPKKRSRLAVTAGVMGIFSLALLFATPVMYFVVMLLAEMLGEIVAYIFVGAHILALTAAGFAAIGLGCVALLVLWRRKEELKGHGWAITGLCAGPLPVLVGCAVALFIGLELGAAEFITTTVQAVAGSDDSSSTSLAELKSEIEKLRQELRSQGNIYHAASESNVVLDPNGRPVCAPAPCAPSVNWTGECQYGPPTCAPACAAPVAGAVVGRPIQAAAHVAPQATAHTPSTYGAPVASPPVGAPRAEPVLEPAPQPAPRPDAPAEPVEMPESAPVISR